MTIPYSFINFRQTFPLAADISVLHLNHRSIRRTTDYTDPETRKVSDRQLEKGTQDIATMSYGYPTDQYGRPMQGQYGQQVYEQPGAGGYNQHQNAYGAPQGPPPNWDNRPQYNGPPNPQIVQQQQQDGYRAAPPPPQGYQSGFGIYSLNIRRSFADNRGGIGFGAENFFSSTRNFRNEVNTPLLAQSSTNVIKILNF